MSSISQVSSPVVIHHSTPAKSESLSKYLTIPVRTYLHELGHSFAFQTLYTNSSPSISLAGFGFLGGVCRANFSGSPILSQIGMSLEGIAPKTVSSVVSAAGPIVDIVSLLGLSVFSKKSEILDFSQKHLSRSVLLYAASALFWDKDHCAGHDYCGIWSNSGPVAYGAMLSAAALTYIYVNRDTVFKQSIKEQALSFVPSAIEMFIRSKIVSMI